MKKNSHEIANTYLIALFELKRDMHNVSPSVQNKLWINKYHSVIRNGFKLENLPNLIALIHPDFYYKDDISFAEDLNWVIRSDFRLGISPSDACQAKQYTGHECIFNKLPSIRGKCQADHYWPNSLGGPSILDNRLLLCKFHNGMKTNDVSHFDWSKIPPWLKEYLGKIYRLKC